MLDMFMSWPFLGYLCAGMACGTGLVAAKFWFSSSGGAPPMDVIATFMKDKTGLSAMDRWVAKSARDNQWAACFSGISAGTGGLSVLIQSLHLSH